jgi:hypothetical protein
VALDIDAHPDPADGFDGPRLAKERARRVLAQVLAALGCGGDRWPVLLQSPGGGFHLWLPITRGVGSDERWPAAWAAAWVRDHLAARGVELRAGVCEVYPSGGRLRAPCGRGQVLLRVVREDVTDPLALEPWPGTTGRRARWLTHGDVQTTRRVLPMVRTFVAEMDRQRRTLADWLGRPEAAWDPDWGFLARRGVKNPDAAVPGTYDRSQQVDDVSDPPAAGRATRRPGSGAGFDPREERFDVRHRSPAPTGDGGSARGSTSSFFQPANGTEVPGDGGEGGADPDSALVRGPAFWRKVERLLSSGVTEPGTRHDAVLTLCFAWGAAAGLSESDTVERVIAWCGAHPHEGSRLGSSAAFTAECVREAAHYLRTRGPRWKFRGAGRGSAVALGVLVEADRRVLERVDAAVRSEAGAILAFLAGRADPAGQVADPVEWAASLAARLLGDRRVVVDGARRRAAVVAIEELARLGLITRHSGHAVGRHGRRWSVWYRFGSGELPAVVAIDRESWERAGRREVLRPTLALPAPVVLEVGGADEAGEGPGEPQEAAGARERAAVEVRQVGARRVREGLLRALSEGGGPVRLVLDPGPLAPDPARPGYRAAWWLRQWRGAPAVGAFAHAHEGAIVVAPRQAGAQGVALLAARARALVTAWPEVAPRAAADLANWRGDLAEASTPPGAGTSTGCARASDLEGGVGARPSEAGARPSSAFGAVLASVDLAPELAGPVGRAWAAWERTQVPPPTRREDS